MAANRRRGPDVALGLLTAATVVAILIFVLKLWRADLGVPFEYGGDATFTSSVVKNVIDHGWYNQNPDLAAPVGQHLYDFPHAGDNLHLLVIRLLGLFSASPAVVLNVFFLLAFPLSALTALAVLRKLGIGRGPAFVSSVLFALLPYHFAHGESHLFISAYYAVPLSAYLVLAVLGRLPLFERRAGDGRPLTRFATRRTLFTVLICMAVASADLYYAAFTILLLAFATLVAAAFRRSAATLAAGTAVLGIVVVTMLVNFAPTLLYVHEHGRNAYVAQRRPQETEQFSLKLANLLLPVTNHRLAAFRSLKSRYDTTTLLPENSQEGAQTLGLLGSIGFLWLVVVALGATVRSRHPTPLLHRHAALATLTAFLIGTTGGIATLIAYLVSPQLRSWARISIFIAFFSFLALALLLDAARKRFGRTGWRSWTFGVAFAALVVLGAADQTTTWLEPAYASTKATWRSDEAFVRRVEERLPDGASVYQLPYAPFPEYAPPGRSGSYDALKPYLHSHDLRWSTGGMKGRPEDWQAQLDRAPLTEQMRVAVALGFAGVVVDRDGYDDGGGPTEQELTRLLGRPFVSSDGRRSFFDLRAYGRRLRKELGARRLRLLRADTVHPVRTTWGRGFIELVAADGRTTYYARARESQIELDNPAEIVRPLRLGVLVRLTTPRPRPSVTIAYPDGSTQRLPLRRGRARVAHDFRAPPGKSAIRFSTNARGTRFYFRGHPTDPQILYLQLIDPVVAVVRAGP